MRAFMRLCVFLCVRVCVFVRVIVCACACDCASPPPQMMADHSVSAVPVLGADGCVIAVFSSTDLRHLVSRKDIYPFLFRSMREFLAAKVCGCVAV